MKIRPATRAKYAWFRSLARNDEPKSLTPTSTDVNGVSALHAFHVLESTGKRIPCNDGPELDRYLAGKVWHGVTVENVAEDFVNRLAFSAEIKANYPEWVAREIFHAANKYAMKTIGFIPTFVKNEQDCSELEVTLPPKSYVEMLLSQPQPTTQNHP